MSPYAPTRELNDPVAILMLWAYANQIVQRTDTVSDGIDLEARRGETLAVLGRSGTGKSVLLKVLIGLQPPDAGSVRILGHEIAGFRIAQLTDFHCSRQVTPAYLQEAVRLAQAQKPDVIVLTGDFVHKGYRYVDRVAATLSRLSAPLGVYAVLGNHDFSVRNALGLRRYRHLHRRVARALEAQGIRVLRNEAVRLRRGSATMHLTGVEDLWSRCCDLDRALEGLCPSVPCIMLAFSMSTRISDESACA